MLRTFKSRVVRRTFWLIKMVPTWKKFEKRCYRLFNLVWITWMHNKSINQNITSILHEDRGMKESQISWKEIFHETWAFKKICSYHMEAADICSCGMKKINFLGILMAYQLNHSELNIPVLNVQRLSFLE